MNLFDLVPFIIAVALLLARHVWVQFRSDESRETLALRGAWVARIMRAPGFEILAVQTLRNSIMAASVMASTSAVGLMGVVSLGHLRAPGPGEASFLGSIPSDIGQVKYVFPLVLLALWRVSARRVGALALAQHHRSPPLLALDVLARRVRRSAGAG